MICENATATLPPPGDAGEVDWLRIVNHLAGRAIRRWTWLDRQEVRSLAGLAVAMVRSRFDPAKATAPMGAWVCGYGWLQLKTLIRNETTRRRRQVRSVCVSQLLSRGGPGRDRDDDGSMEFAAPAAAVEAEAIVHELLDRLGEGDRGILADRLAGRTLTELADARGKTIDWVRWRLARIRRRLAAAGATPPGQATGASRAGRKSSRTETAETRPNGGLA